ncbi:MAG: hypothetical protein ACRC8Q_10865 [Aeromonas sp.]
MTDFQKWCTEILQIVKAGAQGEETQHSEINGERRKVILKPIDAGTGYRIKPKTIKINGFEVPEPVREPLNIGDSFYVANILTDGKCRLKWEGHEWDMEWLENGLIHLTKDAANTHAKALLSFTKAGSKMEQPTKKKD